MKYKIKVTKIDYCIEEEDVIDLVKVRPEYSTPWYDAVDNKIEELKNELPQTMEFEVDCDKEDLEDEICTIISDESGWLINGFNYTIIE